MSNKLEIDFLPETDDSWASLRFKQEGSVGYLLELSNLSLFLEGLESEEENIYFYNDYKFTHTKTKSELRKFSTKGKPLLSITSEQRAKLSAHLREKYAEYITR